MSTTGEKMRKRRAELGLTLQDVGDAVGVGRATVQRWENGSIKNMGRDKIEKLARILQINPAALFSDGVSGSFAEYDPGRPQMTPQQEVLFDATEDLSDTEMQAVLAMIKALKSTRKGDN